jgi:hypothetical protein
VPRRYEHHGMTNSPEYEVWRAMKKRCSVKTVSNYADYGGRGIKVCERWQSFVNFIADMGTRPSGMTLERIDNDGDYSPENCRWATIAEQHTNMRSNRLLTLNGMTKTLTEWAHDIGMKPNTLLFRIRSGWSEERALTTPVERGTK